MDLENIEKQVYSLVVQLMEKHSLRKGDIFVVLQAKFLVETSAKILMQMLVKRFLLVQARLVRKRMFFLPVSVVNI